MYIENSNSLAVRYTAVESLHRAFIITRRKNTFLRLTPHRRSNPHVTCNTYTLLCCLSQNLAQTSLRNSFVLACVRPRASGKRRRTSQPLITLRPQSINISISLDVFCTSNGRVRASNCISNWMQLSQIRSGYQTSAGRRPSARPFERESV